MTTRQRPSEAIKDELNNSPARAALPRAIEVAALQRKLGTGEMVVSALAIRAAFGRIGYRHNLTPNALLHALSAAGAIKSSHSHTEGTRYIFPGALSRMDAVRMAARNIALFELAELKRSETSCGAQRTPTSQGYLVTFA
ncbi:hypothetical protein [Burkholderia sp. WSM2230]|uniref:hypothetical protein n=1 Tax=Burkholderia sp. WSM2230 TaxID=944435 RepID=UPI000471E397|nr:hypothetical protein [Burkholderia sp. WSM2230]